MQRLTGSRNCFAIVKFIQGNCFVAPSDETLHLLATSYYRSGAVKRAHAILQKHNPMNVHCKLLMAKCCSDLKRYAIICGRKFLRSHILCVEVVSQLQILCLKRDQHITHIINYSKYSLYYK